MNMRALLSSIVSAVLLAGCAKSGDTEAEPETPVDVAPPAVLVTNADSVVVDDGRGRTHIMGAIRYPLGQNGQFTGMPGPGEPAGPVTIYIFRTISERNRQYFKDAGVDIRDNSAYLWPESAPYNGDSIGLLQYVRAIDPALSDEALAAGFGLSIQPAGGPTDQE
jgi:hypothetical protein